MVKGIEVSVIQAWSDSPNFNQSIVSTLHGQALIRIQQPNRLLGFG